MSTRKILFWIFVLSFFVLHHSYGAGVIPRDDMRFELSLATGSSDTSGLGKIVTSTGLSPSYATDSIYGIPFAKFAGTGGLRITTGWNGLSTDDFTLSLWVRVKKSELPTLTGMTYPSGPVVPYGWVGGVSTQYLQTLVSTYVNGSMNSLNLRLRSDYKCAIGGIDYRPSNFYLDAINNPPLFVDCARLSDEKWHAIILRRYNKTLNIRIDNQDVYNAINDMAIGRIVGIGNSLMPTNTGAIAYGLGQDFRTTNFHSFYRGSMASVRLYGRYLNDIEVASIAEENQYAQSDLVGVGGIQMSLEGYSRPFLGYTLRSIPSNLNKTTVQYQYSTDAVNFINIDSTTISDISTGTGSRTYRFSLDMSSVSDGNVTITLRVKSGTAFQNIGTIKFTKSDQVYSINIKQPDTLNSSSKSISATTLSGGVLSLSLTRGNICDGTLIFEEYSELLFTSKTDNAIRVCYKSYFPLLGKTIFRLSEPIGGINSTSNTSLTSKIFDDYLFWTKSLYPRFNDSATLVLDLLGVSATSSNGTINGVTMTDINGDGLVDFLYSRNDPVRRAIIVNNGNYTFKITYKCAIDGTMYYGDCADLNR